MLEMRTGQTCSICGKAKLVVVSQNGNSVQYYCDSCGGYRADFQGTINMKASPTKLHAKSGETVERQPPKTGTDPSREVEHSIKESSQIRYVRDRTDSKTVVFQIAYTRDGRIKHIDCKNCGNKWYLADKTDFKGSFLVDGDNMRCLKCQKAMPMSSV